MVMSKVSSFIEAKGIKTTDARILIAKIIMNSEDHPDADTIYKRASKVNPKIGVATVYRTLNLFEKHNVVDKLEIGEGKARYELSNDEKHHDHIINLKTGEILEFYDKKLEDLKAKIAEDAGFKIVGHRLELFVIPKE
jgi:Fur family ferric uptake transcriptional regulator